MLKDDAEHDPSYSCFVIHYCSIVLFCEQNILFKIINLICLGRFMVPNLVVVVCTKLTGYDVGTYMWQFFSVEIDGKVYLKSKCFNYVDKMTVTVDD